MAGWISWTIAILSSLIMGALTQWLLMISVQKICSKGYGIGRLIIIVCIALCLGAVPQAVYFMATLTVCGAGVVGKDFTLTHYTYVVLTSSLSYTIAVVIGLCLRIANILMKKKDVDATEA